MSATLQVEKGNCGTDVVTLGLTSCTLGKGSEADISFESPYVSRRHLAYRSFATFSQDCPEHKRLIYVAHPHFVFDKILYLLKCHYV